MEKINGEKHENLRVSLEATMETNIIDLLIAGKTLVYKTVPENENNIFCEWIRCLDYLAPEHIYSRAHQFVIGSSVPPGHCKFDDLEGDYSIIKYLSAKTMIERKAMVEELKMKLKEEQGSNFE